MINKKIIPIFVIIFSYLLLVSGYEQDVETSYFCDGDYIMDCNKSVDEDWNTFAYVTNSAGLGGNDIYENITIPEYQLNKSNVYWYYSLHYGTPSIYCWDYSLLSFEELNIVVGINKSIIIPENCFSINNLQIKTNLNYDVSNTRYYEGKLVLIIGYRANNHQNIQSTLKNNYMADNYSNIESIFGSDEITDTCTCSGTENCIVNCADNCDFVIVNMNEYNVLITDLDDNITGKVTNIRNLKNAMRIRIEGGCNGSQ